MCSPPAQGKEVTQEFLKKGLFPAPAQGQHGLPGLGLLNLPAAQPSSGHGLCTQDNGAREEPGARGARWTEGPGRSSMRVVGRVPGDVLMASYDQSCKGTGLRAPALWLRAPPHTACTHYGRVGGGTLSSPLAPRPSQLSPGPGPAPSLGPASVLNLPSHTLHSWKRMRCLPNIPFPLYSRQGPGFEWGQHCVWIKRSFPRLCCSLGGHVTQCWP